MIQHGEHINLCEIGLIGDSDLFRFQGTFGEVVTIKVTMNLGRHRIRSCGCVRAVQTQRNVRRRRLSNWHRNHHRLLDASGLFTVRVTEYQNDEMMTYSVQLDRLSPPSTTAVSINPGDTLLGHVIAPTGDADLFVFNAVSGDLVSLRVTDQAGTGFDPAVAMELYRPDGTFVVATSATGTASIERTLDQTGTFTLRVTEYQDDEAMTFNVEYQCISGSCPTFYSLRVARTGGGRLPRALPA